MRATAGPVAASDDSQMALSGSLASRTSSAATLLDAGGPRQADSAACVCIPSPRRQGPSPQAATHAHVNEALVARRLLVVAEAMLCQLFELGPLPSPPASPVTAECPVQDSCQSPSASPPLPALPSRVLDDTLPPLSEFMGRLTARTRIDMDTVCLALLFCKKLKAKHPQCRGSHGTGHRLFLASMLTACKYLHDDAYENSAWAKASAGLFSTAQVNEIEYEFLFYLEWELHIRNETWEAHVDDLEKRLCLELRPFLQRNRGLDGHEGALSRAPALKPSGVVPVPPASKGPVAKPPLGHDQACPAGGLPVAKHHHHISHQHHAHILPRYHYPHAIHHAM